MVPYAVLFKVIWRIFLFNQTKGIERAWLRLLEEKGVSPEPWTAAIADGEPWRKENYDLQDIFDEQLDKELEVLQISDFETGKYDDGFVWKLYLEYGMPAREISRLYGIDNQEGYFYAELTRSNDERVLGYGSYLFDEGKAVFEKDIWNKLPADEQDFFGKWCANVKSKS